MYDNFYKINPDKQKKIITSAVKEFVENGFDKASTNAIIEKADISKGSLFNYFKNKKGLYIFVVDYSIEVVEDLYNQIDQSERDVFKRLEDTGLYKFEFQKEYPYVFDFLIASLKDESKIIKDVVSTKVQESQLKGMHLLYKNIDYSKFKEEIDIEKAIEILTWTMQGFADKFTERINTFEDIETFGEEYLKEWQDYSKILKNSFYK